MTADEKARAALKEAHLLADNAAGWLSKTGQRIWHAKIDALTRAAFAAGMDLGLSIAEAATGARPDYPPVPDWLPKEGV